jgi:isopenicillin N synthase-like dioxygenase
MVLQKNTQIPLIDVSKLLSGGPEALEQTAAEIGAACRATGFFYVTGHNVPQAMIEAAFRKSREFFALGQSQKDEVSFFHSPHNRGYIGFLKEALDATKPPDLKEAFNIGLELAPDAPELLAGVPFRGSNLWPGDAEFRDIMLGSMLRPERIAFENTSRSSFSWYLSDSDLQCLKDELEADHIKKAFTILSGLWYRSGAVQ